jgi:hypothetical protein
LGRTHHPSHASRARAASWCARLTLALIGKLLDRFGQPIQSMLELI